MSIDKTPTPVEDEARELLQTAHIPHILAEIRGYASSLLPPDTDIAYLPWITKPVKDPHTGKRTASPLKTGRLSSREDTDFVQWMNVMHRWLHRGEKDASAASRIPQWKKIEDILDYMGITPAATPPDMQNSQSNTPL